MLIWKEGRWTLSCWFRTQSSTRCCGSCRTWAWRRRRPGWPSAPAPGTCRRRQNNFLIEAGDIHKYLCWDINLSLLIFQQTGSLGQRRIELCPDPNPNSVIRISLLVILLITVRSAFSSWPKCINSDHDQHCIYSWEEPSTSLGMNTSQNIVINKKENKRTADHTEILFQKGTITNHGVSW